MSVRKNMLSLLVSQLATWAVSLVLLVEAPDRLGKQSFSDLTYAIAFVMFFTLVAGLGTGTLMTKEIARDRELLRSWVHHALWLKAVLWLGLSIIAVALALVLGKGGDTLVLILIGLVGMAFVVFNEVYLGALAGMEIMAKPAAFQVAQVYAASLLGLLVLALDWGVIAYGAAFALASAIPLVGNFILLQRHLHGPRPPADPEIWRLLVRGGVPLMALAFFNMIYGTIDIPILDFIAGDDPVAWYGLAYRWVGIPIFIATAVVSAYFPRFSAHGKPQTEEFPRLVNRAIRLVLLVSVPAALGLAFVADDLIAFFYTPDFDEAIPLIRILALHIPIAAMDTILAVALIAADRQNKYLWVSASAAVLNPIACVLLIRWADRTYDNGAIGAAIVTCATELWVMVGAMLLKSKGVLDRASTIDCLRIVVASLVLIPVLVFGSDLPLLAQIGLGVVAYAIAALLLRAVTVEELRSLARSALGSATARRRRVSETVE